MPASSPPDLPFQHTEGQLAQAGGKRIFWQGWLPPSQEPEAIVVIAHGASEHGARYRYVVEHLLPEGVGVYAIDHRGHGRTGKSANIERLELVLGDLDKLVGHVRREHQGVPVFLLGHSMGGCIATQYALERQGRLAGLILSSPLAALEAAPAPLRLIAAGLSVVAPGLPLVGVAADGVSRDPVEVADYEADPLNHHGKLPARTVQELAKAIGAFERRAPAIKLPLLVMVGTADTLVPIAGCKMLHDRAASQDKTLKTYEGFYHELFNEPEGQREVPLGDLVDWLADRIDA